MPQVQGFAAFCVIAPLGGKMLRLRYGGCPATGRCGGGYDRLAWSGASAPCCSSSRRGEIEKTCSSRPLPRRAFARIYALAEACVEANVTDSWRGLPQSRRKTSRTLQNGIHTAGYAKLRSRSSRARVYSMTSSALARTATGIARPRALAVFRLTTVMNVLGRSIGRSSTLAPLRILST